MITQKLKKFIANPHLLIGEIRKGAEKANIKLHQQFRSDYGELAIDQDWDNLIILDACRYDTFVERNHIEADLSRFRSAASHSWEFMEKNFVGRNLHDTVYVSANGFTPKIERGTFHALISLLDKDQNKDTVLPETVIEAAVEASEEYQNKRLIVHFMQPHFPFIGPTGRSFYHRGLQAHKQSGSEEPNVWEILQWKHSGYDDVDEALVWKAYRENVDIAIDAAEKLLKELSGKTVVSADHGVLIGDRMSPIPIRGYGHSSGLRLPEVTDVPWLVVKDGTRKEIVSEDPVVYTDVEANVVEDRLQGFGYK
ncbi:hypothetical protein ACFQGT_08490 [Natrialbaceae archaeon GCM10025810]|uniref:hypothetical protein n=1 Tax=Halovalidus salilacus TaxID=3075124 RepID=UPI003624667F